ncbi:MAG TPA: DUF427 domain-containing protein [Caulobacteraceae bacterium]|nr:DUF427 domain-containing protein [Caulobacteraceae bacterium]
MSEFSDVPLRIKANLKRVRAVCMGCVIADTNHAITLFEADRPPVHYFPPDDVELERLAATGRQSHCPVKGDAELYTIRAGERAADAAAWIFDHPQPAILALRRYVAFDPAKVEVIEFAPGEAVFPLGPPSIESWDLSPRQ